VNDIDTLAAQATAAFQRAMASRATDELPVAHWHAAARCPSPYKVTCLGEFSTTGKVRNRHYFIDGQRASTDKATEVAVLVERLAKHDWESFDAPKARLDAILARSATSPVRDIGIDGSDIVVGTRRLSMPQKTLRADMEAVAGVFAAGPVEPDERRLLILGTFLGYTETWRRRREIGEKYAKAIARARTIWEKFVGRAPVIMPFLVEPKVFTAKEALVELESWAAKKADDRPALTFAFSDGGDDNKIIGTDGHRLLAVVCPELSAPGHYRTASTPAEAEHGDYKPEWRAIWPGLEDGTVVEATVNAEILYQAASAPAQTVGLDRCSVERFKFPPTIVLSLHITEEGRGRLYAGPRFWTGDSLETPEGFDVVGVGTCVVPEKWGRSDADRWTFQATYVVTAAERARGGGMMRLCLPSHPFKPLLIEYADGVQALLMGYRS